MWTEARWFTPWSRAEDSAIVAGGAVAARAEALPEVGAELIFHCSHEHF